MIKDIMVILFKYIFINEMVSWDYKFKLNHSINKMESTMFHEFKRCLVWSNIMVSSEWSKCKDKMSSDIFKL